MAHFGSSLDIGEEMEAEEREKRLSMPAKVSPSAKTGGKDAGEEAASSNVELLWDSKSHAHHHGKAMGEGPGFSGEAMTSHSKSAPSKDADPRVFWKSSAFSLLALLLVVALAVHEFSLTEDFTSLDRLVESQMLDGLRVDVSRQIAEDYRPVSEARKRFMFLERFNMMSKAPEVKFAIQQKQRQTKDMFRDGHGMPYLYTQESYRFVSLASAELGMAGPSASARSSSVDASSGGMHSDDRAMGSAIALFHRYSGWLRPSGSVEWSGFYFPVAIGVIVVVLVSLAAFILSLAPFAVLVAGVAAAAHPMVIGVFSAGIPHPSVLHLVPFWILAASMLALVSSLMGRKGFKQGWRIPVVAAIVSIAVLYLAPSSIRSLFVVVALMIAGWVLFAVGVAIRSWMVSVAGVAVAVSSIAWRWSQGFISVSLSWASLIGMGRGLLAFSIAGCLLAVWIILKRKEGSYRLAAAAGLWIGVILVSPSDVSGVLVILASVFLAGVASSESIALFFPAKARAELADRLFRLAIILFAVIIIAGVSYVAVGTSAVVVLPAVDDALVNASSAIRLDAAPGAVFVSDPVTSDPVAYFSGARPALGNRSSVLSSALFARAMASSDDSRASSFLKALSCPDVIKDLSLGNPSAALDPDPSVESILGALDKNGPSCPRDVYLVVTDIALRGLVDLAAKAGVETYGQTASGPVPCAVRSEGGIACQDGFLVLDLNATRRGAFPQRMVSFIGEKRVVDYNDSKMDGSFVIYRENGRLFSMMVPKSLDDSLLVRAIGHDAVPFLREIAASSDPTHAVVYKIVDGDSQEDEIPKTLGKDVTTKSTSVFLRKNATLS